MNDFMNHLHEEQVKPGLSPADEFFRISSHGSTTMEMAR